MSKRPACIGFDYGNTLIEYGPRQMEAQFQMLCEALRRRFGDCPAEELRTLRMAQVLAPYQNDFVENNLDDMAGELIETLFGVAPTPEAVEEIKSIRHRSFQEEVTLAEEVRGLLERLAASHALALVSNYPCGRTIRDSLDRLGIAPLFASIVISGEIGRIKPNPLPFTTMLDQVKAPAEDCLFVGDNWLADIQGSKRMGMRAVWVTQHVPYETFHRKPDDRDADGELSHLLELEAWLNGGT